MKRYGEHEVVDQARELLARVQPFKDRAVVVGLSGDLGAGKTTLVQGIAAELGVVEEVQSPTFVVMKSYKIHRGAFQTLVHIDAYRLESVDELQPLHFSEICKQPQTLIVIEWPERIISALPSDSITLTITHDGDHRVIHYAGE